MAPAVVGLTGGIGSGKSEALAAFHRRGAATLSSDDVVRDLYRRPEVAAAVAERFGDGVVAPSGEVDRSAIARLVFADEAERRWLESMLLPLIFEEFTCWRDAQIAAGVPLLVHEAPTLFEAGVEERYDAIVTITAPAEVREARRPARPRGWRRSCPRRRRRVAATTCTRTSATLSSSTRSSAG